MNEKRAELKVGLGGMCGIAVAAGISMWMGLAYIGWMSGGAAEELANDRAETAVIVALTPICVANALKDPDSAAKLAALKAESRWSQDDYVQDIGWATMLGEEKGDIKLAAACAEHLENLEPEEVAKT